MNATGCSIEAKSVEAERNRFIPSARQRFNGK